jgi:antitoxin VapB
MSATDDTLPAQVFLLIKRIQELTGESKNDVLTRSLDERLRRLTTPLDQSERKQRILHFLETSVWSSLPDAAPGRRITQDQEDEILGYGPEGV